MNRFTRRIAAIRERMSDSFSHIGWGFIGQQCNCDHVWPNMNWLAKRTDKYVNDWADDAEHPRTKRGRMLYSIGCFFCGIGIKLVNGKLMTAYFQEQRVLDLKAEAIAGAMLAAAANARDITPRKKRRNKKPVRLTRIQQIELHMMWKQGATIAACARRFKVSYPTARKHINVIEYEALREAFSNEAVGMAQ